MKTAKAMLALALLTLWGGVSYAQTSVEQTTFTAVSATNIGGDTNLSYTTAQGGASTAPAIYNDEIRLYQKSGKNEYGGTITIKAADGYKLNSVTIGSSMATTIAYTLDDETTLSESSALAAKGKYTKDGIEAQSITFYCLGSGSKARIYVNYLGVTYTSDGTTPPTPTLEDAELSFPETSYTATLGEAFTAPTLTNPHSLTVTYASSNEAVATVDASTGEVIIVGAGTTTITASSEATDTYKEGSANYTLTVVDPSAHAGTLADPFTVADLLNSTVTSGSDKWIHGYIVGCGSTINDANIGKTDVNTSLFLAASADETSSANIVPVQLPKDMRDALALTEHADYLGKEIWVRGDVAEYFKKNGVKNADQFTFTGIYTLYDKYDISVIKSEVEQFDKIALTRTLTADGGWYTLCLPFDVEIENSPLAGATVMGFSKAENNVFYFETVTTMEAQKPYIVKPTTTVDTPVFEGTNTITSTSAKSVGVTGCKFVGVYKPKTLATDGSNLFLGEDGVTLTQPTTEGTKMYGYRGYFDVDLSTSAKPTLVLGGESTAIDGIRIDGQTVGGRVYTLGGQLVGTSLEALPKGIYVQGGKKIVVK